VINAKGGNRRLYFPCLGKCSERPEQRDHTREGLRFVGNYGAEQTRREFLALTSDEKATLRKQIAQRREENPAGKQAYTAALALLGDEESLRALVGEFLENDGASPGILGDSENPHVIELVAAQFFRNEPMKLTGGDVVVLPPSYRAAELAVEVLAKSPAFNADVINWARTVSGLTWSEKRDLIRPWWKANAQLFDARDYKAVQPGPNPPRDLFAIERPVDATGPRTTGQLAVTPPPFVVKQQPSPAPAPTPSMTSLVIGAAACFAILAGLLLFWKRRRQV
jgi:hypothetical protein